MVRLNRLYRLDRRRTAGKRRRGGAVTLELILVLPVWLIGLLAVIEFGALQGNQQQVALASRVGAEEAAQTPNLNLFSASVPANVTAAITHQLASSGISWCGLILEHNVGGATTLTSGSCDCTPPATALPAYGRYVRVSVCVPLTDLVPNLLGSFGLDLSHCKVQQSTTYRYELSTP